MPKIWEGVKGSPVTAVSDFNLETRPLIDEQIATRASAFIKRNAEAGKPFFAYVCFTQMHPPLVHHPDFKGKSGGGVYADIIHELDYRSGQVLDAIDEAGIAENTIVVWCSDNGTAPSVYGGSNGPWRGGFGSGFEGGMRTPAIVRWPGKVEAGAVTDEILAVRRLAPDAGVPGRGERAGALRPSDRRGRRLAVPPRAEPHDRTRSRHRLRVGRADPVDQVENDEGRVPLQRQLERSAHPETAPHGVRPRRGSGRGDGSRSDGHGLRLGPGAGHSARIGALMQSMAQYPNIKPGEEFTGYA